MADQFAAAVPEASAEGRNEPQVGSDPQPSPSGPAADAADGYTPSNESGQAAEDRSGGSAGGPAGAGGAPAGPPAYPYYQPATPPWQQQQAPPFGLTPGEVGQPVDWNLLNQAYVQARAEGIRARYDGPYRSAATEAERAAIRERYEGEGHRLELAIERARLAQERWTHQEQTREMQARAIVDLRQKAAERLAADLSIPVESVLRDQDGNDIWDPNEMRRNARQEARFRHGERVAERSAAGTDRAYRPSGGAGAVTEDERWARMSETEFEANWSRHRSGGRPGQV